MSTRRQFLVRAGAAGVGLAVPAWIGCSRATPKAAQPNAVSAPAAAPRIVTAPPPPPQRAAIPANAFVLRPANARGGADHGWLNTKHSFSFARYQDPNHMGFRALRVINEDKVLAGQGFPMHGHRDMEILTWVLDGSLQHRDSLGNGSIIGPGDAQRMSAGTGIRHSEFEPSRSQRVHFLQIWLHPDRSGHKPGYEQKRVAAPDPGAPIQVVASPNGAGNSVKINQDARILVARVKKGAQASFDLPKGRHAWLQVARGGVRVNGVKADQGDGLRTSVGGRMTLSATADAEVLIFDLA